MCPMITVRNIHVLKPDTEAGITADHIKGLAESYAESGHRAPVVIGHPKDNHPAWGWVKSCRAGDGGLYCDADVTPEFKEFLDAGRFKERSVAFYNSEPPVLRHLGFLGAVPPRIKGLEPITFSESDDDLITQTDILPIKQIMTPEFTRPVVLFALSEAIPGIKASNITSDPVVEGETITGVVELSDGKSYSYTIAKDSQQNWSATTQLRNPEVVTLSEEVAALKGQLATQAATAKAETLYKERKLTEAIFPKQECVKLLTLCEGELATKVEKLLNNLPALVPVSESQPTTPETPVRPEGFDGFQLSDSTFYQQVVSKATELGLNPNNHKDFITALNSLR